MAPVVVVVFFSYFPCVVRRKNEDSSCGGVFLLHQVHFHWREELRHLPFTSSIRVEILGVNIQCWSLSKRKTEISQNVLVSIRKFTKKRKNALIKPVVFNLWNVSNGMACTISFSNQNFQAFRLNGKRPWIIESFLFVALFFLIAWSPLCLTEQATWPIHPLSRTAERGLLVFGSIDLIGLLNVVPIQTLWE